MGGQQGSTGMGAGYDISASLSSSASAANRSQKSSTGGNITNIDWKAAAILGVAVIGTMFLAVQIVKA